MAEAKPVFEDDAPAKEEDEQEVLMTVLRIEAEEEEEANRRALQALSPTFVNPADTLRRRRVPLARTSALLESAETVTMLRFEIATASCHYAQTFATIVRN